MDEFVHNTETCMPSQHAQIAVFLKEIMSSVNKQRCNVIIKMV